MFVIDEVSGKKIRKSTAKNVIVDIIGEGSIYVFGYVSKNNFKEHCIKIESLPYGEYVLRKTMGDKIIYSSYLGRWILSKSVRGIKDRIRHKYKLGHGANAGNFIYSFKRNYEAIDNFSVFKDKQMILKKKYHPMSEHIPYTFGLEYETSQGYIPEEICFRDGLIPLRDGSISGLEYSSVVMNGNEGICLLEQQLKSLKKYTVFNKECSLHIHFGGFPMNPDKIWNLYSICYNIQGELKQILPPYTFNTAMYKNSGKDYCKMLPELNGFHDLYQSFVGKQWNGSFTCPHPNDRERKRKWNIPTRYYFVNFINILCYDVNKTIEFRFLRPTYNVRKIKSWIHIFTAILKAAEKTINGRTPTTLQEVIGTAYSDNDEMWRFLMEEIEKQRILTENQVFNGDNIGSHVMLENLIYDEDEII